MMFNARLFTVAILLLTSAGHLAAQERIPSLPPLDKHESYRELFEETNDLEGWRVEPENPHWIDFDFWAKGKDPEYISAPAVLYCQVLGNDPMPIGVMQREEGVLYVYYDFTQEFKVIEKGIDIAAPFFVYRDVEIPRDGETLFDELVQQYWVILESEEGPLVPSEAMETLLGRINELAKNPETPNRDFLYNFYYYLRYGELFPLEGFGAMVELRQYFVDGRFPEQYPHVAWLYGFVRSCSKVPTLKNLGFDILVKLYMNDHGSLPIAAMVYGHYTDQTAEWGREMREYLLHHQDHWAVKELGLEDIP